MGNKVAFIQYRKGSYCYSQYKNEKAIQAKILCKAGYANKQKKREGIPKQVEVALSEDKSTLLVWSQVAHKKNEGRKIQLTCYDLKKVMKQLINVEKKVTKKNKKNKVSLLVAVWAGKNGRNQKGTNLQPLYFDQNACITCMFICVFRYRSARQFGASRIAAAMRIRPVLTISAGHCRTTSVPGAWRLAQDSARVAVKIDALICRAERDRVADLHIVAEQSEFHRGPARGVHHAVIDPMIRGNTDRRANGDTKV